MIYYPTFCPCMKFWPPIAIHSNFYFLHPKASKFFSFNQTIGKKILGWPNYYDIQIRTFAKYLRIRLMIMKLPYKNLRFVHQIIHCKIYLLIILNSFKNQMRIKLTLYKTAISKYSNLSTMYLVCGSWSNKNNYDL